MLFQRSTAALAALVICCAAPAFAKDSISIDVTASIAQRCGVSDVPSGAAATTPDLDHAQNLSFGFNIDCNTPFAIGVSSQNGALVLQDGRDARSSETSDGFSREKEYSVALAVETDGAPLNSDFCSSAELTGKGKGKSCEFYGREAGTGMSSGRRTAIRRNGSVVVRWNASDRGARRAAGTYQDTLTVVVGPRS